MPFIYGGGINNLNQVKTLFSLGVEKISLNSSVFDNYELIKKLSDIYGSQSTIISVDICTDNQGYKKLYN